MTKPTPLEQLVDAIEVLKPGGWSMSQLVSAVRLPVADVVRLCGQAARKVASGGSLAV